MYILTIYCMSLHTMRFPVSAKSSCCCCSLFKNLIVDQNFHLKYFFVRICGDVKKYSHYIQSRVSQGLAVNQSCSTYNVIKDGIKTCVHNKISKSNSLKLNSKYLLLSDANARPLCIFLIHILTFVQLPIMNFEKFVRIFFVLSILKVQQLDQFISRPLSLTISVY